MRTNLPPTASRTKLSALAAVVTALTLVAGVSVATGSMSAASPDDDPPAPPSTEALAPPEDTETTAAPATTEVPEPAEVPEPTEAPALTQDTEATAAPPSTEGPESTEAPEADDLIEVVDIGPSTETAENDVTETTSTPMSSTSADDVQVLAAASSNGAADVWLSATCWIDCAYGASTSITAYVRDSSTSCDVFDDCDIPMGYADFYVDGALQESVLLEPVNDHASEAIVDVGVLDVGTHPVTVEYRPYNFDPARSSSAITIAKADCTVSLSGPAHSTVGDNVVFDGPVTSNSEAGTASGGTLTVLRESQGFVVRTIDNYRLDVFGVNNLPIGFHNLWISYVDANHNECTTNFFGHAVHERMVCTADRHTVDAGKYAVGIDTFRFDPAVNDVTEEATTLALVQGPGHGIAGVTFDGDMLWYQSDVGFTGTDTLTYSITNGAGQSDTCTVTFDVVDPIVAVDDQATTQLDQAVTVDVLANDSAPDPHSYVVIAEEPAHGTVEVNDDETVTYTPAEGYTGTDSFVYQVADNIRPAATATVTITIHAASTTTTTTTTTTDAPPSPGPSTTAPAPPPSTTTPPPSTTTPPPSTTEPPVGGDPVAVDDSFDANADGVLLVGAPGVLANDLHPDGSRLTAQLAVDAEHGTVVLNADGSFAYTPDAGFVGTDSFSYVASDGAPIAFAPAGESRGIAPGAVSAPASVTITVNPADPTDPGTPTVPAGTLPATR